MGALILGLRPGDHRQLDAIAARWGRPSKEAAGLLLERAIRNEQARQAREVARKRAIAASGQMSMFDDGDGEVAAQPSGAEQAVAGGRPGADSGLVVEADGDGSAS
jgi:hypothetical protein